MGLPLSCLSMDATLDVCRNAVETNGMLQIGVVNAAKVVKMRRSETLRDSVLHCDLLLADGMAIVWASRLLRRPLPERVAGIDLFENLLAQAEQLGRSVYLLGATDEVIETTVARIREEHPRLKIAGHRNGYFTLDEDPQVAAAIAASGADYLFVGITSPRKEIFLDRWGPELGVHVCHGVGGSFDVLAGKVRRAPRIMQRLGLEWFYRVLQEPRRLWKRYLTTNTMFAVLLTKELFAQAAGRRPREGHSAQL